MSIPDGPTPAQQLEAARNGLVRGYLDDKFARHYADLEFARMRRGQHKPLAEMALDLDGLAALPDPEPLIGGWLQRDSLAWLSGPPESAKSFVALDIAGCVATGMPWHGYPVTQGPVLYVVAESPSGFKRRVPAWEAAYGTRPGHITFLPYPVQVPDPADMAELAEMCQALPAAFGTTDKAALIVLDTQSRCATGIGENDSSEMSVLVAALDRLRAETGACVVTVHHTPRNGTNLRGSNSQEGAATTIIAVRKDGAAVTVSANTKDGGKQKDIVPALPLKLELSPHAGSAALTEPGPGTVLPSEAAVLDALADGRLSKSQLARVTGLSDKTVFTAIRSLRDGGRVTITSEGRYQYVEIVQNADEADDSGDSDSGN